MSGANNFNAGNFKNVEYITNVVKAEQQQKNVITFLRRDGAVFSMGVNNAGQLGTGYSIDENNPYPVSGGAVGTTYLTGALDLADGNAHAVALLKDHTAISWGENTHGQLGDGSTVNSANLAPIYVKNADNSDILKNVVNISAGGNASGALVVPGAGVDVSDQGDDYYLTWGENTTAQQGDGTTTDRLLPGRVSQGDARNFGAQVTDPDYAGMLNNVMVFDGWGTGLAAQTDGKVYGWNTDTSGLPRQVGVNGDYYSLDFAGASGVYEGGAVVTGIEELYIPSKTVVLTSSQSLVLEELQLYVEHGFNLIYDSHKCVLPLDKLDEVTYQSSDTEIATVSRTGNHFVVTPTGNRYGRLVISLAYGDYKTNFEVQVLPDAPAHDADLEIKTAPMAKAGVRGSIALRSDGTVWTWGTLLLSHAGLLASKTASDPKLPIDVSIANLFYDTTANREYPHPVDFGDLEEGEHFVAVDVGYNHYMALTNLGHVYTWGSNEYGQLGIGTWNSEYTDWVTTCNPTIYRYKNTTDTLTPQKVAIEGVTAIAAGAYHSVVLKEDGSVWAWGLNTEGQVGACRIGNFMGSQSYSCTHSGYSEYGGYWSHGHSGTVYYRVANTGALYTSPTRVSGPDYSYINHSGNSYLGHIIRIEAMGNNTVAVRADGQAYIWGDGSYKQLTVDKDVSCVPVVVQSDRTWLDQYGAANTKLIDVIGMTVGANGAPQDLNYALANELPGVEAHGVALNKNGEVFTWGSVAAGALGDGVTTENRKEPKQVPLNGKAVQITAGGQFTMVRTAADEIYAWGANTYGQLGIDSADASAAVPTLVVAGDNPAKADSFALGTTMDGGENYAVFTAQDGTIYIMGHNGVGKYNYNSNDPLIQADIRRPDRYGYNEAKIYLWYKTDEKGDLVKQDNQHIVAQGQTFLIPVNELYEEHQDQYNLLNVSQRGKVDHADALVINASDASVATAEITGGNIVITAKWPGWTTVQYYNTVTQYTGSIQVMVTEVSDAVPAAVAAPQVVSFTGGVSMALKADGTVWSWGTSPAQISGVSDVVDIAGGQDTALALTKDGAVYTINLNNRTAAATTLKNIGTIAAGREFGIAVDRTTGEVYSWRNGAATKVENGLSASTTQDFKNSIYVSNIVEVSAGDGFVLLRRVDGALFTYGTNADRQLGTGYTIGGVNYNYIVNESHPTPVSGGENGHVYLDNALSIATGEAHSVAMVSDKASTNDANHKVMAWGRNISGQLGTGTASPNSPYPVYAKGSDNSDLTYATQIYAGGNTSGAVVVPAGMANDPYYGQLLLWEIGRASCRERV